MQRLVANKLCKGNVLYYTIWKDTVSSAFGNVGSEVAWSINFILWLATQPFQSKGKLSLLKFYYLCSFCFFKSTEMIGDNKIETPNFC